MSTLRAEVFLPHDFKHLRSRSRRFLVSRIVGSD